MPMPPIPMPMPPIFMPPPMPIPMPPIPMAPPVVQLGTSPPNHCRYQVRIWAFSWLWLALMLRASSLISGLRARERARSAMAIAPSW